MRLGRPFKAPTFTSHRRPMCDHFVAGPAGVAHTSERWSASHPNQGLGRDPWELILATNRTYLKLPARFKSVSSAPGRVGHLRVLIDSTKRRIQDSPMFHPTYQQERYSKLNRTISRTHCWRSNLGSSLVGDFRGQIIKIATRPTLQRFSYINLPPRASRREEEPGEA